MAHLPVQTCWKYWLKLKDEFCLFLDDLNHLAPKIQFHEFLGAAGQGVVLKVQIDEKIYALKLYRFMTPHWSRRNFKWYTVTGDPFFVECQTYDHLIEAGLNGEVGPFCYGWLTISKEQEKTVNKIFHGKIKDSENREKEDILDDWRRTENTALEPIRGILLEYIDGCSLDKAAPPLDAQSLRNGLAKLHSLNIAHGDFKPLNIMVSKKGEGRFIDFGSAKLWPNVYMSRDQFNTWRKDESKYLEYFLFRLQKSKCFQGVNITSAATAEEAFGGELSEWLETDFPELPKAN